MKKLAILIFTTCIITSCSFWENSTTKNNEKWNYVKTSVTGWDYTETLKTTSEKIKQSEEFNKCMDMNVNMCVNMAGSQIAQKTQSIEFCNELQSSDQQESCKFGIIINKSQSDKNISLCDELEDAYKSRCKNEYAKNEAIRLKDPKLCENLRNAVSGEINEQDTRNRDQCIMNITMQNPNRTYEDCKTIKDANLQKLCSINIKNIQERNATQSK
jgi:hypothetical protein